MATGNSFDIDNSAAAPRSSGAQRLSAPHRLSATQGSFQTASRVSIASFAMGGEQGEGLVKEAMQPEGEGTAPAVSPGLTFAETVANFVIGLVGAGVLILPRVMAEVGYAVAVTLLLVAAVAVCQCALMIIPCCQAAESCTGGSVKSYEALADAALGAKGKLALTVTKNCYMLGVIVVYALLVVDGLDTWLTMMGPSLIRWCIVLPVFVLLAMLKDLKQIARLAPLGICAAFVQAGSIVAGALVNMTQGGDQAVQHVAVSAKLSLLSLGAAAATCVFGFGSIVCTIPAVRAQMANVEELPLAIRCGLAIVAAIYLSVMGLGYASFGSGVQANVLNSITHDCTGVQCIFGSASALAIIINLLVSMPSIAFFVISVIESFGSGPLFTPMAPPNIASRALLILLLVVISDSLPFVKEVIGLISASLGCINCFVFPLLLHYALKKVRPAMIASGPLITCAHLAVTVVGVVAIIFGTMGSLKKLLEEMAKGAEQASQALDLVSALLAS